MFATKGEDRDGLTVWLITIGAIDRKLNLSVLRGDRMRQRELGDRQMQNIVSKESSC